MKVLKFGGTSVGSPEAIKRMVDIVLGYPGAVLVVSAFSGVTDKIISIARTAAQVNGSSGVYPAWLEGYEAIVTRHRSALGELCSGPRLEAVRPELETLLNEFRELLSGVGLLRELSPRSLDLLMSFGERLSAVVVAAAFRELGVPAVPVDARGLIVASGPFGNARPVRRATDNAVLSRLGPLLSGASMALPVVTGFIAATDRGETVTLGRGGSDFSAAVIAAALDAEELEIWTDVDGIMTADPRKVPDAFPIDALNYDEAMELSHFGARVIYPPTIQPALDRGIPIRIRNSFNPAFKGTVITFDAAPSKYPVRGITSISPTSLILVQGPGMVGVTGIAGRLFGCLARKAVNIILISQASSERSICFAVMPNDREGAIEAITEEFATEMADGRIGRAICEEGMAILAVVGERMKHSTGIAGRIFDALGSSGVNVTAIAQGSSELNVSAVVSLADEVKALRGVHDAFFLAGTRSVNVALVGTGLVGGTLLEQLRRSQTVLFRDHSVRLKVVGISNSRNMLFDEEGINLEGWRERLDASGEAADLQSFVAKTRAASLPNVVFADCTASTVPPNFYASLLKASVAVVTPNKKGNSGLIASYQALMDAALESGSAYLYETTVGAGLPVISTLGDLIVSGDRVIRMEAMLSGTLGYILTNFEQSAGFGRLVRKARDLGYTEPDPREDLAATDFARKALILAREAGFSCEFADIVIEPIVSDACLATTSLAALYATLDEEDAILRSRFQAARGRGKQLVYAATIDASGIRLGLREVGPDEPLFGIHDAENVVAFTTERYSTMPLVVRGPGAGAEVTAGGIFADIVRVARTSAR